MSARSARVMAWSLWVLTIALLGMNIVLSTVNGALGSDAYFVVIGVTMAVSYATVGALVATRHRSNPVGWLLMVVGLGFMFGIFCDEITRHASLPGTTPWPGTRYAAVLSLAGYVGAVLSLPLIFLHFPDGELPSPRWRIVRMMLIAAGSVALVLPHLDPRPLRPYPGPAIDNPFGVEALRGIVGPVSLAVGMTCVVLSLLCAVALFVRYRRATAEVRQQLRWLAYVGVAGVILLVLTLTVSMFVEEGTAGGTVAEILWQVMSTVVALGVPAACGVAILKYRLYDLDVVVKRTVVFGVLAVFVTAVYVGLVVGVGALVLGSEASGANAITFAAAAVVALAFQPVRNWGRRLADRLVYGRRATPYEVLSEFSDRLGGTYSTEDVLPRMAQLITAGTGATRAEVWLKVGPEYRLESAWPDDPDRPSRIAPPAGDEAPEIPGSTRTIPVVHQGEPLGAIAVIVPASEPLTPTQEKLLADLAAQAGLVLRNVALTASLRARLEELRASRERLVKAQDDERRRIERNLHDGAQQQLVALAVRMRLAGQMVDRDPAKAKELMEQLQVDTRSALDDLRDLARGIYPPLLADQGLGTALEAQARRAAVPVRIDPNGVGRYAQEVEAAVYFCVLEAVQNAAKYAEPTQVTVGLEQSADHLLFRVVDDGRGFDAGTTSYGTGLQGMADRLEALGGRLVVRSDRGAGTVVEGSVPTGPVIPWDAG